MHFFKTRADIATRTHNGELDLVSCKGDHNHLEKRHDEFLVVIVQEQRGPCLLLPEISVLSCICNFLIFTLEFFAYAHLFFLPLDLLGL